MDAELRKRIEEAARNFASKNTPEDIPCYDDIINNMIGDFIAGAKLGYKEAIAQTKEWMQNYFPQELDGKGFEFVSRDEVISDFESDMNKLWREKK